MERGVSREVKTRWFVGWVMRAVGEQGVEVRLLVFTEVRCTRWRKLRVTVQRLTQQHTPEEELLVLNKAFTNVWKRILVGSIGEFEKNLKGCTKKKKIHFYPRYGGPG